MATRYIGQATVRVDFTGDREYNYQVSVSAPGIRGKRFYVGAPKSGFGPGVAYDSAEAYDDIAAAAAKFALHDNRDYEDALGSAMDLEGGSDRVLVRRAKTGRGNWV